MARAVDATLVSPVTRDGRPHDGADHHPGWAEIDRNRRCRLVVFGLEVGGGWAEEAATFVRLLARARAASAPAAVRQAAWVLRWSGLISVAACARCHFPGSATSPARAPGRRSLAAGS